MNYFWYIKVSTFIYHFARIFIFFSMGIITLVHFRQRPTHLLRPDQLAHFDIVWKIHRFASEHSCSNVHKFWTSFQLASRWKSAQIPLCDNLTRIYLVFPCSDNQFKYKYIPIGFVRVICCLLRKNKIVYFFM